MNPLPYSHYEGGEVISDEVISRDSVAAPTRGYIHSIVGAVFVLVATLGYLNSSEIAVIMAVVVALADLVLVLIYTRTAWRKALYPVLYAGGGALLLVGTFNEAQVAAIIGLGVAVLGTQIAAAKAPVVVEGSVG